MVNIKNKTIIFLTLVFLFIGFVTTGNITGNSIFNRLFGANTPGCYSSGDCVIYENGQKQACNSCSGGYVKTCYCDGSTPVCKKSGKCPSGKCAGNICAPTVCGDGVCNTGENCLADCCKRNCAGKKCGSDGCGSSCGTCSSSEICNNLGKCVTKYDCRTTGQQCNANYDCCSNICTNGYCSSGSQTCNTCASLGYSCGTFVNNCGNTLTCGTCVSGQSCVNNKCIIPYNPPPPSCTVNGGYCSTDSQCCSNICTNGYCSSGSQTCNTCASLGYSCGTFVNNCGVTLTCGTCIQGKTCNSYKQCVQQYNCVGKACPMAGASAGTSTPTTSQCIPKCYSSKYKGCQNADGSWNGLRYCNTGCNPTTGQCY